MKVVIAGSRDFDDYDLLKRKCDRILRGHQDITVVSGGARGADALGERYATEKGFEITRFPADWDGLGKSAGYVRNKQMAEYSDALIAFWDGSSKGTKHMIDLANSKGIKTRIIYI